MSAFMDIARKENRAPYSRVSDAIDNLEATLTFTSKAFGTTPAELIAMLLDQWAYDDTTLEQMRSLKAAAATLRENE